MFGVFDMLKLGLQDFVPECVCTCGDYLKMSSYLCIRKFQLRVNVYRTFNGLSSWYFRQLQKVWYGMMVQWDSNRWRSGAGVLSHALRGCIAVLLAATAVWEESKRAVSLPSLSGDRVGGTDEPGICNETQGAWREGPSSHKGIQVRVD